jgi:hypothetical protein
MPQVILFQLFFASTSSQSPHPKSRAVHRWKANSCGGSFRDFDFGGGEGVKVIDQGVNLAVEAVAAVCRGQVEFLVGPNRVKGLWPHTAGPVKLFTRCKLVAWCRRFCAGAARESNQRLKAPAFITFPRGKKGWQERHNPEAAGPVRTMSSPHDLISRKILF